MHENDFADGRRSRSGCCATPVGQSRVCGPVVDIAEQVKAESAATTSSSSTWRSSATTTSRGLRPQLNAYNLRTEPWLFAVDRKGNVAARLEGAFSASSCNPR